MAYENPIRYCGFLISAHAYEVPNKPGVWRASFAIDDHGNRFAADNVNDQSSRDAAEQNALALALQVAKGNVPMPHMLLKPGSTKVTILPS